MVSVFLWIKKTVGIIWVPWWSSHTKKLKCYCHCILECFPFFSQMNAHTKNVCPRTIIPCKYAYLNCKEKVIKCHVEFITCAFREVQLVVKPNLLLDSLFLDCQTVHLFCLLYLDKGVIGTVISALRLHTLHKICAREAQHWENLRMGIAYFEINFLFVCS